MFTDLTTWLNWGLLALFMANVALLNWLTVTIILHGERRTLAGWLVKATMACSVLLLASDMQIIRSFSNAERPPSAIPFGQAIFPGLIIPYVWYLVTRQYCTPGQRRKRHSVGFWFTTVLAVGLAMLFLAAYFPHVMPLPLAELRPRIGPFSRTLLAIWPLFSLLCAGLSFHVLCNITAIPRRRHPPGYRHAQRHDRPLRRHPGTGELPRPVHPNHPLPAGRRLPCRGRHAGGVSGAGVVGSNQ